MGCAALGQLAGGQTGCLLHATIYEPPLADCPLRGLVMSSSSLIDASSLSCASFSACFFFMPCSFLQRSRRIRQHSGSSTARKTIWHSHKCRPVPCVPRYIRRAAKCAPVIVPAHAAKSNAICSRNTVWSAGDHDDALSTEGIGNQQKPSRDLHPPRLMLVTGDLKRSTLRPIRSQSLMTPAMFIVRAEVLPISRKTAMLSAAGHKECTQLSTTRSCLCQARHR